MADYYTKFSTVLKLPSLEAQAYAVALIQRFRDLADNPPETCPPDFPDELWQLIAEDEFTSPDCVEPQEHEGQPAIWIYPDESANLDFTFAYIQHLLIKFCPDQGFGLEWCNDCSRPRLDAYGGGAAWITATEIRTFSTGSWLDAQQPRP